MSCLTATYTDSTDIYSNYITITTTTLTQEVLRPVRLYLHKLPRSVADGGLEGAVAVNRVQVRGRLDAAEEEVGERTLVIALGRGRVCSYSMIILEHRII